MGKLSVVCHTEVVSRNWCVEEELGSKTGRKTDLGHEVIEGALLVLHLCGSHACRPCNPKYKQSPSVPRTHHQARTQHKCAAAPTQHTHTHYTHSLTWLRQLVPANHHSSSSAATLRPHPKPTPSHPNPARSHYTLHPRSPPPPHGTLLPSCPVATVRLASGQYSSER